MNTLDSAPLSSLLERLFADADRTQAELASRTAQLSADERRALFAPGNHQRLYTLASDIHLAVSRETARLLYLLASAAGCRAMVEFGTSFGLSTLHLAAALRDNGGGRLVSTELLAVKAEAARANLAAAGLADLVEIRVGDARETLAHGLPPDIGLVLLDGAKPLYADVLRLLEPGLKPNALIVADNADMCPEYLERVRNPASGYLSVPCGGDVEISMRLGGSGVRE